MGTGALIARAPCCAGPMKVPRQLSFHAVFPVPHALYDPSIASCNLCRVLSSLLPARRNLNSFRSHLLDEIGVFTGFHSSHFLFIGRAFAHHNDYYAGACPGCHGSYVYSLEFDSNQSFGTMSAPRAFLRGCEEYQLIRNT